MRVYRMRVPQRMAHTGLHEASYSASRRENHMKLLALVFFAGSYVSVWQHDLLNAVLLLVCSCVLVSFSNRGAERG